jgi:Kef-type K+ transport system membrane component KefB
LSQTERLLYFLLQAFVTGILSFFLSAAIVYFIYPDVRRRRIFFLPLFAACFVIDGLGHYYGVSLILALGYGILLEKVYREEDVQHEIEEEADLLSDIE